MQHTMKKLAGATFVAVMSLAGTAPRMTSRSALPRR
ncbi:branched chain amino acid ABC transporter periplasmic ligand-binding protein [Burkholderia pseudomallei]|nr:branched chain amino acid ABC transporter periplasmic ligand-binding protein [Burkholderia pseudomallei]